MNIFYPVAKAKTRQHLINPAISAPAVLEKEQYTSGEQTAYVKPGEVPNLLSLVQPDDVIFTQDNNPVAKDICITEVIFALWHKGKWVVAETIRGPRTTFCETQPGIWELDGQFRVPSRRTYLLDDEAYWDYDESEFIMIPIKAKYIEQTRAFSLSTSGNYDSGTVELLGIKLEVPVEGEILSRKPPTPEEVI